MIIVLLTGQMVVMYKLLKKGMTDTYFKATSLQGSFSPVCVISPKK